MPQSPQPWLSYKRQCPQTPKYQYITAFPLTPANTSFLPCDKRTKWPPWTKRPIIHQHRVNWSLQPIDWQWQPAACLPSGSGPKGVYTSWGFIGHVGAPATHTSTPRTPGHKAFRSQLTANELGGLRFAGVGPKWSTVQPRSARANPLWQPRAQGIWGRYLPTKITHLSGTLDAHGSDLQLMPPPGTSR